MKTTFASIAFVLSGFLSVGSVANAAVVDFEEFAGTRLSTKGTSLTSQGFNFISGFSLFYTVDGSMFSPPGANNGTTFLINGYSQTSITRTDGSSFSLSKIDLGSSYYTDPSETIFITGNFTDGSFISTSALVTNASFKTFDLTGFDGVSSVTLSQSSGYLGIDNVIYGTSAATVPEPTTVALLGLGLLGFAASGRKAAKSKNA